MRRKPPAVPQKSIELMRDSSRSLLRGAAVLRAGWVIIGGLLLAAAFWASQPSGADPPASSWKAGATSTTWDWEQHWNYWMEWRCTEQGHLPHEGRITCLRWSKVGPTWKSCGPKIRPPDPSRINSCNIGQAGGHKPHGDGLNERHDYLGRHQDRTGPTYRVCAGDLSLPADTSPGNCGTWVTIPHQHCPGEPNVHPPNCSTTGTTPPGTTPPPPPGTSPPGTTPPEPSTPTTRKRTTTTKPRRTSDVCEDSDARAAFSDAVDDRSAPGLGIQPTAYGYVRVPMKAFYTNSPRISLNARIDGDRVDLRLWVARLSWSFTDLGTETGAEMGDATFHRYAADRNAARTLTTPVTVEINGNEAVYLKSSFRAGYASGYPITLTVVWRASCHEWNTSGWTDLGELTREYDHTYTVYEIRSRPDQSL